MEANIYNRDLSVLLIIAVWFQKKIIFSKHAHFILGNMHNWLDKSLVWEYVTRESKRNVSIEKLAFLSHEIRIYVRILRTDLDRMVTLIYF